MQSTQECRYPAPAQASHTGIHDLDHLIRRQIGCHRILGLSSGNCVPVCTGGGTPLHPQTLSASLQEHNLVYEMNPRSRKQNLEEAIYTDEKRQGRLVIDLPT